MFVRLLLTCPAPETDTGANIMGKGDRRTRKGKIAIRSYGIKRPHAAKKAGVSKAAVPVKAPARKAAAPAPKKKA